MNNSLCDILFVLSCMSIFEDIVINPKALLTICEAYISCDVYKCTLNFLVEA
jgi:hypothetical protein